MKQEKPRKKKKTLEIKTDEIVQKIAEILNLDEETVRNVFKKYSEIVIEYVKQGYLVPLYEVGDFELGTGKFKGKNGVRIERKVLKFKVYEHLKGIESYWSNKK